jgi:hapalindole biogenesis HpiC1 cyclase-like protein
MMEQARNWAVRPSRLAGFVALVVVGFALVGVVAAAPITILNYSFEQPPQADGGQGFTVGVATGWVATGTSGVWRPNATQLPQAPTDLLQVGYSNETGLGLSQTLAGVLLTANTQYTLQVDVQARGDSVPSPGSTIQLRTAVDGDILATASVGPLAPGTNFLLTASFFATAGDLNLNEVLQIALLSNGIQSDWDNVRLDATAVPEPTTLLLWGTTAAGLGAAWRRLRGRSFGRALA